MTSFWDRIRQRKLAQWALAYIAGGWLVLQVIDVLGQNLGWPPWVFQVTIALLSVGFLAALVLAWYHGERGRQRVSGIELLMLAGILVIAGGVVALVRGDADPAPARSPTAVEGDESSAPPPVASDSAPSIAVLPLENLSPDPDDAFFAAGMHEEILTRLTKIGELSVRGRTSVTQYRDSPKNLRQIGRELRARFILEGSVQRAGDRVRITTQLIDAERDEHLWAESYERRMTVENLFGIQTDVSQKVVEALQAEITPEEQARLGRAPTENLQAYNLYLTGRHLADRRTTESMNRAVGYFQDAVELDSTYAPAYVGIAEIEIALGSWGQTAPDRAFPAAREAAQQALSLDDLLGEAWSSLGYIRFWYDREWEASERAFRRAIELNPSYSTAHHWYSLLLVALGRFDEAEAAIGRAVELDPLSRIIRTIEGRLYWIRGDLERAVTAHRRAVEIDPGYAVGHMWLGLAYESQSRLDLARRHLRRAAELDPEGPIPQAGLAHGHAIGGETDDAFQLLRELRRRGDGESPVPYWSAVVHADLGRVDRAFEELERAVRVRDGWITDLAVTPLFESLRSDPRFESLVRRLGLE